jgi:ElaB/YqjD/DUF883 family membrane-anchored ribosome-binding protein
MLRTHQGQAEPAADVATDRGASPSAAVPVNDAGGRSLGSQSRKVIADVKELGAIALENVGASVNRLKDQGRSTVAKGRQKVKATQMGFEALVADHPVKSLLVAVGVGALLGLAMRRRKAPVEVARE